MPGLNEYCTTGSRPTIGTELKDMKSIKKGGGRRIHVAPLSEEESPSSVKSLCDYGRGDGTDGRTGSPTSHRGGTAADRRPSPPSPGNTGMRTTASASASASASSMSTKVQSIMNDPDEWSKFREQMKAGGHCTNAAAALDQLMKRAREEEKEANRKAEAEGELETNNVCNDDAPDPSNLDLVNKGLRWINQTLTATNFSQEAEASMNSHFSSDRSVNRCHSMSSDRSIFLEGTISGEGASTGAGQPSARRTRRGGRRKQAPDQQDGNSVGGILPKRRNSADAVMSMEYLATNISAHAREDPMSLKAATSEELKDSKTFFDRQRVFDEDMDADANLSGHLNIPKDDDDGNKGNLITETAKAVRRGSGSLVEYLSAITIGQDSAGGGGGFDSRSNTMSSSGDVILEGWGGGRETAGTTTRSGRTKERGGRRGRSRSFDMLEAVHKGLGHEIDADDFV